MKVLYDHQVFTFQTYGGISRSFKELMTRINTNNGDVARLSTLFSNNEYLQDYSFQQVMTFFKGKHFKGKQTLMNYINAAYSSADIKKGDYDVFHPTYYNTYFLKHIKNKPFTITFLDMIHERFSNRYKELGHDKQMQQDKQILLREASKVITISELTKRDIVEFFDVNPDKIEVIYLGSSFDSSTAAKERIIPSPYLLIVGNRTMYKNFNFFIESVVPLLKKNKDLKVVCAGGGPFTTEEQELIKKLDLSDSVIYQGINDSILANLYTHAEIFVFPSLYEGFGIPVLEAFACGCPCLLSDRGSLPEIGGTAALYFNPEDADSILKAVTDLLNDPAKRAELKQLGLKRHQLFSWDKNYEETMNVYKSLL